MVIIVMGVSGSGKSTIAIKLADRLNFPYFDADDYHSKKNIEKMASGHPLNDHDRRPWLEELAKQIAHWEKQEGAVLACSALKESYREILSSTLDTVKWVYLDGSYDLILDRISDRKNHFMKAEMLKSQFDALEVPEYGLHVDIAPSIEEIVDVVVNKLSTPKHLNK
ncbi:MAG: gluconokinase [Leeuwenhoekiella sp.]